MKWYFIYFFLSFSFYSCHYFDKNEKIPQFTNALIYETSPYLLQHAHNPVNWHAWNEKTLAKAKKENKPLLISIGYAACHWCHVMEKESFEDSSVAYIMNKHFICIKVDREERPDVDAIYMNACQLIQENGGWPLNAIALPDGRPFYALTYAEKDEWTQTLNFFADFYSKKQSEAIRQAEQLTQGIASTDLITLNTLPPLFKKEDLEPLWTIWKTEIDKENGGFKGAPKFPMAYQYDFLMNYYLEKPDKALLEYINTSLTKMYLGGIYDQIVGGFSRYTVDEKWKIPHFEKMLYDNALLVSTYSKAYAITKDENYADKVKASLNWIECDLTSPNGGFYASLNADSDGEEGKYYTWTYEELQKSISPLNKDVINYYNITKNGNWENTNILHAEKTIAAYAKANNLNTETLEKEILIFNNKLLEARNKRNKPSLDDKIITAWNALTLKAYLDAYQYLGEEKYLNIALKNANFISNKLIQKDFSIYRNYKNDKATISGFLDDYSFTIEAYIQLYQLTFDEKWLNLANELTKYTLLNFSDEKTGMFFYNAKNENTLIARKTEVYDQVMPSSNATMAYNLHLLGHLLENKNYLTRSDKMLNNMKENVLKEPVFYAKWLMLYQLKAYDSKEIVISGENALQMRKDLKPFYLPNHIILGATKESKLPLLENKYQAGKTLIYVCENKVCKYPVSNSNEALKLIFE